MQTIPLVVLLGLLGLLLFYQSISIYFKPAPVNVAGDITETQRTLMNTRVVYTYRLEYASMLIDLLCKFSFCFLLYTDSLVY